MENLDFFSRRCIWVNGPVIVGADPSGLATAAYLREQGVPFVVLERADCIASLWQRRTYDRLKLHLPKQFCQLPNLPFPDDIPEYPSKKQFINYLETYANKFEINPQFNECVQSAKYDETIGLWRVKSNEVEYICRWLVFATDKNAECVTPEIEGLSEFKGEPVHACDYKSGENFTGNKFFVVGCGNSGMELSFHLSNHHALHSMVVRNSFVTYEEEEDHEVNEEDIEAQISYEAEETIPKSRSKRLSLRPKWVNDYVTALQRRGASSSHRFN